MFYGSGVFIAFLLTNFSKLDLTTKKIFEKVQTFFLKKVTTKVAMTLFPIFATKIIEKSLQIVLFGLVY